MNSFEIGFTGIEALFVVIVTTFVISIASLLAALVLHLLKDRTATSGAWKRVSIHSAVDAPLPLGHIIDIREFLRQESESLDARLQAAGMALELELPANSLPVLLNRPRMQEVFAQLVELARNVMTRGSTLQVLARIDGTHAVVNFMDAPSGADAPRLGRWFDEVYARSLRPNTDNHNDACARVAVCGKIVGEHQGRIYAAPSPLVLLCHKSSFALALPQQGHCPRRAMSR